MSLVGIGTEGKAVLKGGYYHTQHLCLQPSAPPQFLALAAWSCLTLRDSMYCSLPGPSVHEVLPLLEWAVIPFSPGNLPDRG